MLVQFNYGYLQFEIVANLQIQFSYKLIKHSYPGYISGPVHHRAQNRHENDAAQVLKQKICAYSRLISCSLFTKFRFFMNDRNWGQWTRCFIENFVVVELTAKTDVRC